MFLPVGADLNGPDIVFKESTGQKCVMTSRDLKKPAVVAMTVFMVLLAALSSQAQQNGPTRTRICPLNVQLPNDLTIRSVKVTGRRGVGPLEKKLGEMFNGKTYTRELHRQAMVEVENELTKEANESFENHVGIEGGATQQARSGAVFLRTDQCVEVDETNKSVDMIVRVLFLRVDLKNVASNLLTLPRSIQPSFYDKMPVLLRTLNPIFDFDVDRKLGSVAALNVSTNLLEFSNLVKGEELSNRDLRLLLNFNGQKSFGKPYYATTTDFVVSKTRPSQTVEQLDFTAFFRADDQPLSETRDVIKDVRIGGEVKLRPRKRLLNTVYLSGNYSGNRHNVYDSARRLIVGERNNAGMFRGVVDGVVFNGFTRLGVWLEGAEVNGAPEGYKRLAGLFGYQKEFGAGTQTLGVEALLGGGKAWGRVPFYAGFFGGNSAGNFLYEAPGSPATTEFPTGPYLRSYGKSQAGARTGGGVITGGTNYWHANMSVAIPVRPWSRRLIPDEIVHLETTNQDVKLNELLETFTINTAKGTIGASLLDPIIEELRKKDPSLTEEQAEELAIPIAEARAKEIVERDVAPHIRFIARHANLFAVKPLVMFDYAQIGGTSGSSLRRYAAGGGVQLVLVLARAEIGYMKTLTKVTGEPRGNVVFRLTFQNLF